MGVSSKLVAGQEVLRFSGMVIMEGCTIGLTIAVKTVLDKGTSPFVFVVYTNALATLLLFPFSFIFHRQRIVEEKIFTLPFLGRFFFMGLTGMCLAQNLAFLGLSYTSPIVVCAMGLLTPALSFILALFLRITKLNFISSSFQFKLLGMLLSITGAIVVLLYKGAFIRPSSYYRLQSIHGHPFTFYSTSNNWILGVILVAASSLCVSIWNVIQSSTVQQYRNVMKIASFYSLAGTIQCAIFSLLVERDWSAWKLKLNLELLLIIITAIFGSVIRSSFNMLCTQTKGPLYVALFQPFRIFWATFFGVAFFTNNLHYGSVIGAVICGTGYYTVMWGQVKEVKQQKKK